MKVIRSKEQKEVKSDTCGLLKEVLAGSENKVSITTAKDIKPTKNHYHKKAVEIYWVVKGWIEIKIRKTKNSRMVKLHAGDLVIIEPHESHKVVKASEKNDVIVICCPSWRSDDVFE